MSTSGQADRPVVDPARSRARRWLWKLGQLAILGGVLFFVTRSLADGLRAISWTEIHFSMGYALLSAACMVAVMVLIAAAYRAQLAPLHAPPSWLAMLGITWLSRTGKYLPGKVLTVAGAAYLLRQFGVPAGVGTGVILLNSVLTVLTGFIISAPLMFIEPLQSRVSWPALWGGLILLGGLICVHPRVYMALINLAMRLLRLPRLEIKPRFRHYAKPILYMMGQWLFTGLSLWCLTRSIGPARADLIIMMTAASGLAVTLGFVALFAPGGIGVREGVYLLMLTPVLGSAGATVVTISFRIVQTIVEIALAAAGYMILHVLRKQQRHGAADA